jgi:energy-coupling factor transport system ATP-binding protein
LATVRRRTSPAAIAATLAMLPAVLILDEPTAALDPRGRQEVFRVIEELRQDRRMTIVMVSQDAEHVAAYADRLALLVDGRILREGPPVTLFQDADLMQAAGIAAPQLVELSRALRSHHASIEPFWTLDGAEAVLRADLEPRP